jgi:nucleosome assembly protein 1-like 1
MLANGNPALIEAMQRGLARMVGSSSGYIESLPAPVRARIDHLENLQEEYDILEDQMEEEMRAIEEKYHKLCAPLLDQRRAIITGDAEAPDNQTPEGQKAMEALPDVPAGIPEFWATALSNHPDLEERITDKDKEVLAYLTDVSAEDVLDEDGDEIGFKIIFKFKENPFLTDSELKMVFHITETNGYMSVQDIEGCDIHWCPDKDVTVKKMRKKPKPGSKNKQPQTKLEPVDSFFRWFTDAPEVPESLPEEDDDDDDMEELRDLVESHTAVAEVLREDVIPNAVKWFTGQALLEMDDEDEDDDEDDEFDDDDDEDDDSELGDDSDEDDDDEDDSEEEGGPGGVMPKDSKEQPAECKQQ